MKQTRQLTLLLIVMMGGAGLSEAAVFRRQSDAFFAGIPDRDRSAVATGLNGDDQQDSSLAEELAKKKSKPKSKPKPKPKPKTKAS